MFLVLTPHVSFDGYGPSRERSPYWSLPLWMEAECMSWQPEIQGWRWDGEVHSPHEVDGRRGYNASYRK